MPRRPFISVVIPAHNCARIIESTLQSLLEQNYPEDCREIIVVNNGSTDDSGDRIRKYPVTLIEEEKGDPGLARNIGVEKARGEIILFLDSDVVASPELLSTHARLHEENPEAGGAGGPIRLPEGANLWERCDHYASWYHHHDRLPPHVTPNQPTANLSIRREVWDRVGGFLLGIYPAEDREWQERFRQAGCRVHFHPDAWVYHYNRVSYRAFLNHNYRWAYYGVAYKSRKGQSRFPWAYPRNAALLLFMTPAFAFGSWGYTLWQWIKRGVWEPVWLSPLLLRGRLQYAWGVYVGGREHLRQSKHLPANDTGTG